MTARNRLTVLTLCLLVAPVVHAQWAVIDVAAVARLTSEVRTLEQSLATEQQQMYVAQQQLRALTGDRGMEDLLSNVRRNYLPQTWAQLSAVAAGDSASYPTLAAAVRAGIAAPWGLSAAQLAQLSPPAQRQLRAVRRNAALLQTLSATALANASGRFAGLKQLIAAIGAARDQKAILDLNTRIAAEQTMLANEQTKLRVLFAAAQAQRWVDRERSREAAIAAQGDFATRFQPTP